jgi:hypothetical protein
VREPEVVVDEYQDLEDTVSMISNLKVASEGSKSGQNSPQEEINSGSVILTTGNLLIFPK